MKRFFGSRSSTQPGRCHEKGERDERKDQEGKELQIGSGGPRSKKGNKEKPGKKKRVTLSAAKEKRN